MSGPRSPALMNAGAAAIIALAGIAAFFSGINAPFHGDDLLQIVNNVPVHSIGNIGLFFRGGTFYDGKGLVPLAGTYYRPLMSTTFSMVWSLFGGANTWPFHLVQQMLTIGSAFLLYLVFVRCSFARGLALTLALIFLVHPINSQSVFALPWLQDSLFFFFGILAFWMVLRFRSQRALIGVAVVLFAALLSKETAALFVIVILIYVIFWNRSRLWAFAGITAVPVALWLAMRTAAVGFDVANAQVAPIDRATLLERILTEPAIVSLYLAKLVWPVHLATSYYFVERSVTWQGFVLPVGIDLLALAAVIGAGLAVRRAAGARPALHRTYWFFAVWAALGVVPHLQVQPLDATANEVWFRFSMAGVLGMAGIVLTAFGPRLRVPLAGRAALAAVLVIVLGIGTALRGTVWTDTIRLAQTDIANSPDDWLAYSDLAAQYLHNGNCQAAIENELRSVAIFPSGINYYILGNAYMETGRYAEAAAALQTGLSYENYYGLAESMAQLTTVYGTPEAGRTFILSALQVYPGDSTLWTLLAYLDYTHNNRAAAQQEIAQAHTYAPDNDAVTYLYGVMTSGAPLTLKLAPPSCGHG